MKRIFTCGVVSSTLSKHVNKNEVLTDIVKSIFSFEEKDNLLKEEIKNGISKYYGIRMLEEEITTLLSNSNVFSYEQGKYKLLDKNINQNTELDKFIDEVFEENLPDEKELISQTIYTYLYQLFYNQFESLMKSMPSKEKSLCVKLLENGHSIFKEMSEAEILYINKFLAFNSPEKDRLVFDIVKNSIDFVGVIGGKPIDFSQTSLVNRTFYLDSNVLFRGVGINGEERRDSILHFMEVISDKKLKSKVYVTDLTTEEYINTIKNFCNHLKKYNLQIAKVKNEQISFFDSNAIFSFYLKWKQSRKGDVDVDSFQSWCINSMWSFISKYKIKTREISVPTNQEFIDLVSRFQFQANRNVVSSAEVDLANLLFVQSLRKNEPDIRIASTFIITCDSQLISFCRQQVQLPSNVCFLPSFWLTLLLEFTGRVDDHNALKCFSNFLRVRSEKGRLSDQETLKIVNLVNDKIEDSHTANICIDSVIQERICMEPERSRKISDIEVEKIVETEVDKIQSDITRLLEENQSYKENLEKLNHNEILLSKNRDIIDELLANSNRSAEKTYFYQKNVLILFALIVEFYTIYSIIALFTNKLIIPSIRPLHLLLGINDDLTSALLSVLILILIPITPLIYNYLLGKFLANKNRKISDNNIKLGK